MKIQATPKIRINREALSSIFWNAIFTETDIIIQEESWKLFHHKIRGCEQLRKVARFNTGSISLYSAELLYRLGCFFSPSTIGEVGTFIGRSTLALGLGSVISSNSVTVHTCDKSNDIKIETSGFFTLHQYSNVGSSDMFTRLLEKKVKFDVLNIDGRLAKKDLDLLPELLGTKSVIILDDFEGVEKGVLNVMAMLTQPFFKEFFLIYPVISLDRRYQSKLAVFLHQSHFGFTAQ